MPETIEILEDLDIIKVTSYGEITDDDLRKSRETINKLCSEHGYKKLLFDATKLHNIRTLAAYEHGVCLAKYHFLRISRHAIIATQDNRIYLDFICTVGTNRGAQIKVFEKKDEATTWLNNC
jgi:hypothetical protein